MPLSFPETILTSAKCSIKDRLALIPVIQTFQTYIHQTRREGTLCLEQYLTVENQPNIHLIGIKYIVNGYEPDDLATIFMNIIQTSNYTGQELLYRLLIAEGFHCIISRKSKGETLFLMHSLLGEELCDYAQAELLFLSKKNELNRI